KLLLISLPFFAILYFVINNFVNLIFGDGWNEIIVISNILMPLFFIRFISSTLSVTLTIYGKEKEFFLMNILILLFSIIPFGIALLEDLGIYTTLKIQSFSLSIIYLAFL